MQEGRTNLLEKPAGDLKILIRFTGKADNHIDSEKNAGNLRPDRPDPFGKPCGVVPPPHQCQNPVAPALQRHMKMRLELIRTGSEGYYFIGQQVRFDRRNPVTVDSSDGVQRTQQIDERFPGSAAEITHVNPGQHDLALSFWLRSLRPHAPDRPPAGCARTARQRNRTITAMIITAVLHLEKRAGSVATRKSGEKTGQLSGLTRMYGSTRLAPSAATRSKIVPLSLLPTTRSTPSIAANSCGLSWA